MDIDTLPLLSLDDRPDRLAAELGKSFGRFGFALITDHGIDPDLIERGWRLTAAFFALPLDEKRRYWIEGLAGARGYTPPRTEIAKGAVAPDLKEFWHVGRDLPAGHPLAAQMPPNIWPGRPEHFHQVFSRLFAELDRVGAIILSHVALHLGLAPEWFDPVVAEGNSILRLLHYPPVSGDDGDAIRAGAHEDINLITLLLGAEEAGLELRLRDGRWLPVTPPPGALVVNIGDMLQRLTNHRLPSTTHRVRNPVGARAGISRYSMPFFVHPRSDFRIATLAQCVTVDQPNRYPSPITADDYLQERLREIGLRC